MFGMKPLLAIALISVLAINPLYNVDNARVNYTMTLSATGEQISISGVISIDIAVSEAGVATVDVDMGVIPAEWTFEISAEELPTFILSKAEIAALSASINGETIALREGGKETDVMKHYYGASLLLGESDQSGDTMSLKWNKATGIVLSLHAESEVEGENIVVDVEYISSDVDIYSDLNLAEKMWNQMAMFFMTPWGIVLIIAIAAIAIVLVIKFRVLKKVKRVIHRRRH
jgi:hypothetical protein